MKQIVVLAPNWLGDAVMALPAIADVRRGLPGGALAVAARPSVAPLFTLVPGIDRIIPLDKRTPRQLAGFDTALLLPNSFHAAYVVARAGIPERWGYRTDCRGVLLTRAIDRPPRLHQVEYYQHLVRALDFPNGPPAPRVDVSAALRDRSAGMLRQAGWDGQTPIVALAPGAAYGSAKRWPPAHFAELAAGLAADGVATVLVGSAADAPTASEVRTALAGRARILDLMGSDLPSLAGVLSLCRATVANDSGAAHLAAAVGAPVTTVFGPTDERVTAPRGDDVVVLTHKVWCRPCMLATCPLDHRCMDGVDAATALDAVRRTR